MSMLVLLRNDKGMKQLEDNRDTNGLLCDTRGGRIFEMTNLVQIKFGLYGMRDCNRVHIFQRNG